MAIDAVAGVLGNTRAVCRRSYIHPAILDAYMDGSIGKACRRRVRRAKLRVEEALVLTLLKKTA